MLQVFTNSPTLFGLFVIWVSLSLQWITFIPNFFESPAKFPLFLYLTISSATLFETFLSLINFSAISIKAFLVKWEISPGLAPWSTTAVGEFLGQFFDNSLSRICL